MNFYQRLIDYSRSVSRQYKASRLPIVVAIVINSTTRVLLETEIPGSYILFAKQLSSIGWARAHVYYSMQRLLHPVKPISCTCSLSYWTRDITYQLYTMQWSNINLSVCQNEKYIWWPYPWRRMLYPYIKKCMCPIKILLFTISNIKVLIASIWSASLLQARVLSPQKNEGRKKSP